LFSFLTKIFYPLKQKDFNSLLFILFLTLITTFFDLISIGLIIPILDIFIGNDYLRYINYFDFLSNFNKEQIFIGLLILMFVIFFIKFLFTKYLIYFQNNFSYNLYVEISNNFFKRYLSQKYIFHLGVNSSKLIRNVQTEVQLFVFSVVLQFVKLFSEIIIFLAICILLMVYEFTASLLVILIFTSISLIIIKYNSKKLKKWGQIRQESSSLSLKQILQAFASIQDIIMNNLENIFSDKYRNYLTVNSQVSKRRDTLTQLSRPILELIGVSVFILLIVYLINTGKEIFEIFTIIGVFFFATTKLLPSVSKIVQSLQSIKYNSSVVNLIYNQMIQINSNKKESFNHSKKNKDYFYFKKITFENVSFKYPLKNNKVLDKINLEIYRNQKIGIMGETGSGKSTLINLFNGLLDPTEGCIKINNLNSESLTEVWQNEIGYVPQKTSIIDESILFNITLKENIKNFEQKKVYDILKKVEIYDFVNSLPKKIYNKAGENGKSLSGGQAQRLGIARSLYMRPSILVLDEATSALDEKTENKILYNLFNDTNIKTIIIISHKFSSLKYCDKIYKLSKGKISEI
jgi:ABC-type multidrug transport system fused ATPase/permease subunit